MTPTEVNRFNKLYQRHPRLLKLQGKSQKTIDVYARAIRRVRDYFDCCLDKLTTEQLKVPFPDLVESHTWSTVKNRPPWVAIFLETRAEGRLEMG